MAKHNRYQELFKRLRGYFISPHLNIWNGLRKKLFDKDFPGNISELKDFIKQPPPELFNNILEKHHELELKARFSQLNDLEQQPGNEAFGKIMAAITKQKSEKPGIIRSIAPYKKIIAAAAVVIVLIGSIFIFKRADDKNDQQQPIVNSTGIPSPDEKQDSLSGNVSTDKLILSANKDIKNRRKYFDASNFLSFHDATIGDNIIPVEYNDLLFSFAKYPYRLGRAIDWNDNKGTIVRVNAYTAIRISPYMSAVMADLYKVKTNGRATVKARKAKAKINRWKKTDTKRFDKKKGKNPLDIIDLGENVY